MGTCRVGVCVYVYIRVYIDWYPLVAAVNQTRTSYLTVAFDDPLATLGDIDDDDTAIRCLLERREEGL